jgi:alpha-tubulin suppressor-like RCC1 family protein
MRQASQSASATTFTLTERQSSSTSCLIAVCIYDYSYSFRTGKARITSYLSNATGDVAPISEISGQKTRLHPLFKSHFGIAVGPEREVYAYNSANNGNTPTIEIYAAAANGNVAPIAAIAGSNTGLLALNGHLAVDDDGAIYAASEDYYYNAAVTVYAAASNGDASPIQTISGSFTGLHSPQGIAVDPAHNIYVVNNGAGQIEPSITVYASGANGNVAPTQEITGANTRLQNATVFGMALDSAGNIYVVNKGVVLVFAAGATGNVAPIRTIVGNKTKMDGATGVALDGSDNVYVCNTNPTTGESYITVYRAGTSGNHRPMQIIQHSATLLSGHQSTGIAVR